MAAGKSGCHTERWKIGMNEQIYNGTTFLGYANEAAAKIRKISQMISGMESPEDGSLLGDVDYSIYIMIQMYLAPITGKEIGSDELNDMAVKIMSAEKDGIDDILKRYCGVPT